MESNLKEHEKYALLASIHLEYCKKEVEDHRQKLSAAKRLAESIAVITPKPEKAFLEEKWLSTLRNIVSQINKTFSWNFQQMAVAGEVSLGRQNNFMSLVLIISLEGNPKSHSSYL